MRKLKIGVVLYEGILPSKGGGFSYYNSLIEAIDNYTFDESIEICFINFSKSIPHSYKKEIIAISQKKQGKIKVALKNIFLNSNKSHLPEDELAKNGIDLLYYTIPFNNKLNYPYIMTNWDLGHKSMFAFPEVSMNNAFEERNKSSTEVLNKAFAIFAESEAGKNEIINYERINPKRIFVVPMFPSKLVELKIDEAQQTEILKKWNLIKDEFFFYPAQFWSHKNHYSLLIAFKMILDSQPNIKLVFTGSDKGNLEYIKEVININKLENNVIIAGFVSEEEIFTFYKNAISLVMPTYLGPTNMPLLEAKAIGCPIICSDFIGHREQLGDDGAFFINPAEPRDIFEKMLLVFNKREIKKVPNQKNQILATLEAINKNLVELSNYRKPFGNNFKQH